MTPEQRSLRAQLAAHARWARTVDTAAATAPATAGFLAKFEREVDPEGVLPEDVRARMAESARKAHFKKLALKSSMARAARAAAKKAPRDQRRAA